MVVFSDLGLRSRVAGLLRGWSCRFARNLNRLSSIGLVGRGEANQPVRLYFLEFLSPDVARCSHLRGIRRPSRLVAGEDCFRVFSLL
jgi:hypothetical protein